LTARKPRLNEPDEMVCNITLIVTSLK